MNCEASRWNCLDRPAKVSAWVWSLELGCTLLSRIDVSRASWIQASSRELARGVAGEVVDGVVVDMVRCGESETRAGVNGVRLMGGMVGCQQLGAREGKTVIRFCTPGRRSTALARPCECSNLDDLPPPAVACSRRGARRACPAGSLGHGDARLDATCHQVPTGQWRRPGFGQANVQPSGGQGE